MQPTKSVINRLITGPLSPCAMLDSTRNATSFAARLSFFETTLNGGKGGKTRSRRKCNKILSLVVAEEGRVCDNNICLGV